MIKRDFYLLVFRNLEDLYLDLEITEWSRQLNPECGRCLCRKRKDRHESGAPSGFSRFPAAEEDSDEEEEYEKERKKRSEFLKRRMMFWLWFASKIICDLILIHIVLTFSVTWFQTSWHPRWFVPLPEITCLCFLIINWSLKLFWK